MPRTITRLLLVVSLTVGGLAASSSPASASFHLMMIREVSAGSGAGSAGDFIELQMYAPGQHLVAGKQVKVYQGAVEMAAATFAGNVGNGANQATILIAPAGSGLGADASLSGEVPATQGKACFVDPGTPDPYPNPPQFIDCVAWGSQMSDADTGTPAPAIPPGQSIERTIARGCATALDPADDTNSSAADLAIQPAPNPEPNSSAPNETACTGGAFSLSNLKTKVKGGRAIISGKVQPPAPGQQVKLTFFANGSPLRKIATKSATLNAASEFKKRFKVPPDSTRCKIVVKFQGSKLGQKKFRC